MLIKIYCSTYQSYQYFNSKVGLIGQIFTESQTNLMGFNGNCISNRNWACFVHYLKIAFHYFEK